MSGFGVAHELSIINGAAAAATTAASPVIARAPLNVTHKIKMESNGEEIEIEGLGTGTTVCHSLCFRGAQAEHCTHRDLSGVVH